MIDTHMKRLSLIFIFLLSRSIAAVASDCGCKTNLESLIASVEHNYVGYYDKVNPGNYNLYSSFKDSLRKGSTKLSNYDCYLLLKKYILFFADPHLTLNIAKSEDSGSDSIQAIFSKFPRLAFNEKKLRTYFKKIKPNSIEGIWQANMVKYRVAVIKDTSGLYDYIGFVLDGDNLFWFPGQLKMGIKRKGAVYLVRYLRSDHYPDDQTMRLEDGEMLISGYGTWRKTFPAKSPPPQPKPHVRFSMRTPDVTVLSIANFSLNYKNLIDSIIRVNRPAIARSKYFLIDLRNNSGGVSMSYDELLPLVAMGPVVTDGFAVRSSQENIEMYKQFLSDPNYPEETKEAFRGMIQKMEEQPDTIVRIYGPDTTKYTTASKGPQHVAIIINEGTVSAAELFILQARQSKKVTVFGTHSKGALDYTEIGNSRPLPCPYLSYYCPMGMNDHRVYPYIDNKGITPDVVIKDTEPNWIDYVIRYYVSKK
jgi:hypothetical protein